MKSAFLFLLFTCLGTITLFAQTSITVPKGAPIMIDGKFSDKEWGDAKFIFIQDSIRLYFKQTKEYVFIGIQPPKEGYNGGWMDLYIADGTRGVFNLHASRKLGERKLENGQWKEWEKWWTNEGSWRANYLRQDDIKDGDKTKTIQLKDEGWEYQISKERFSNNHWKLLFDIAVVRKGLTNIKYPGNVSATQTDNWLSIKL